MEFKQTVQVITFSNNPRPALMGTALHCTTRSLPLKPPHEAEIYHNQVVQTEAVQELTHTLYSSGNGITFDMLQHAQSSINGVSIQPDPKPVIDFMR